MNKRLKKILITVLATGMCIALTSCSMPEDMKNSIRQNFEDRATANKMIVEQIYGSGIITQDTHDKLISAINDSLVKMGEGLAKLDEESAKNLLKACVGWHTVIENDHPVTDSNGKLLYYYHSGGEDPEDPCFVNGGTSCTNSGHSSDAQCLDHTDQFITNWIVDSDGASWKSTVEKNCPVFGGNSGKIAPIEVISESLVDTLNQELSIPIYVLKSGVSNSGGIGLDEVMEGISSAINNKDKATAEAILANYFEPATYVTKDSNGEEVKKNVTLLDPSDPKQRLVRVTTSTLNETGDPTVYSYGTATNPTDCNSYFGKFSSNGGTPGYDMTVIMSGEKMVSVRLVEFNQEGIDRLNKQIGLSNQRYYVLNGHAYLMEYPIGYIKGFRETSDRENYKSIIKRSDLGFNLKTGEFTKFKRDENGILTNESVVISNDDPYITYNGALSNTDEAKASLVLFGETGVSGHKDTTGMTEEEKTLDAVCNTSWNLTLGGTEDNSFKTSVGRIVLRDYLEATYAPGVQGSDKLVVLGRKIRVLQLEGSKKNPVAEFYDKEGNPLFEEEAKANLYIDDFADIESILKIPAEVQFISKIQEELDEEEYVDPRSQQLKADDDTGDGGTSEEEELKRSLTKIDRLPQKVDDRIECTTPFPGTNIGAYDYSDSDDKPLFYAMLVKKNIFETGMISGWIQSDDATKNSLVWWNSWLQSHGYTYQINANLLVEFLKGNYAYELNKSGVIILDLETISKIQQEYTQEQKIETGHWLRTMFIILGYILIAYSIIILAAWNVDVNVDFGFSILEKLSFGRWVAVKSHDELPFMNVDDVSFITFGELIPKCIIMIALGLALILINIIDLIIVFINLFGGVARHLTKVITGV